MARINPKARAAKRAQEKKDKEKPSALGRIFSSSEKDGFQLTSSTYKKHNKEIIATIESVKKGIGKSHQLLKGDIEKINRLLHDLISKNEIL